eukprot:CAMPEP_0198568504 /NCGR_PEP_ID=MMETSP1462-20131121/106530_1 /TAXON_ID=1333877 /ORGANISM="Brandtodinium nutriculum, Strain RCC3387" /LENGTH=414 /DNA_ID=CAMNT_0044299575 /DNA_START=1 /DNA_END=1242 /DNA_ORIENTATION=+
MAKVLFFLLANAAGGHALRCAGRGASASGAEASSTPAPAGGTVRPSRVVGEDDDLTRKRDFSSLALNNPAITLLDPDPQQRIKTAPLGEFTKDYTTQAIVQVQDKRLPSWPRQSAAQALFASPDDDAIQALVGVVRDKEDSIKLRRASAKALHGSRNANVIHALAGVVQDRGDDLHLRTIVARSLTEAADANAYQALVDVVQDKRDADALRGQAISGVVATALGLKADPSFSAKTMQVLTGIVQDKNESIRGLAIQGLSDLSILNGLKAGTSPITKTMQVLIDIVQDKEDDWELRKLAARSLTDTLEAKADPASAGRGHELAARCLSDAADAIAIQALADVIQALDDNDPTLNVAWFLINIVGREDLESQVKLIAGRALLKIVFREGEPVQVSEPSFKELRAGAARALKETFGT